MKKFMSVFITILVTFLLSIGVYASPVGAGPGWYEHHVTGQVKFFPNGHPDQSNAWIPVDPPNGNGDNGAPPNNGNNNPINTGSGNFYIDANAYQSIMDNTSNIYTGIEAGSGYNVSSMSESNASGQVGSFFGWPTGTAEANIDAIGGALGSSKNYTFDGGYGSISESFGITHGSIDAEATGLGIVGGSISGNVSQVTNAFSDVENSFGLTEQSASGWFEGAGGSVVGQSLNSSATIETYGTSISESYRFENDNVVGTGSYVKSTTNVDASRSGVTIGGWNASGEVVTQSSRLVSGGEANASAVGNYQASGTLNHSYSGSASGYTQTSSESINGMSGSINRASSGMSVSSQVD